MTNLNDLTINQMRELAGLVAALAPSAAVDKKSSLLSEWVGKSVLIRTVTLYHTGKVESVDGVFVRLSNAAWIADMGRFSESLEKGTLSEVECFPRSSSVLVGVGAIVDVTEWLHALPSVTK